MFDVLIYFSVRCLSLQCEYCVLFMRSEEDLCFISGKSHPTMLFAFIYINILKYGNGVNALKAKCFLPSTRAWSLVFFKI